jgi:hypothetical protein
MRDRWKMTLINAWICSHLPTQDVENQTYNRMDQLVRLSRAPISVRHITAGDLEAAAGT